MRPRPEVFIGMLLAGNANADVFDFQAIASATTAYYRPSCSKTASLATAENMKVVVTLEEKIDEACSDARNFEEDEDRPSQPAIAEIKRIIADAAELVDIPNGDPAPYFGEISVTWRCENRMLRLTAFSDGRHPRLDFGTTPERSLGDYSFNLIVNGEALAEKINWLLAKRSAAA